MSEWEHESGMLDQAHENGRNPVEGSIGFPGFGTEDKSSMEYSGAQANTDAEVTEGMPMDAVDPALSPEGMTDAGTGTQPFPDGADADPIIVDLSGISTDMRQERANLSTFQRVSAGFFAQTKEPALTINGKSVTVNSAAARLFPDVDYMEILISTEERKVALKPCDELNIFGYKWARNKDGKRYGTQRTGLPFVLCICQIMGWDPNNRYRILGKKVLDEQDEEVLVFELSAGQGFEKGAPGERGKTRSTILTGWDGTFGPAYNQTEGSVRIGTFDGYTVFSINKKNGKKQGQEEAATDGGDRATVQDVGLEHETTAAAQAEEADGSRTYGGAE